MFRCVRHDLYRVVINIEVSRCTSISFGIRYLFMILLWRVMHVFVFRIPFYMFVIIKWWTENSVRAVGNGEQNTTMKTCIENERTERARESHKHLAYISGCKSHECMFIHQLLFTIKCESSHQQLLAGWLADCSGWC